MDSNPINMGFILEPDEKKIAAKEKIGFRCGDKGTHTSRTIMLEELSILLRVSDPSFSHEEYRRVIVRDNCLGKRTVSTRRLTYQRLSELCTHFYS